MNNDLPTTSLDTLGKASAPKTYNFSPWVFFIIIITVFVVGIGIGVNGILQSRSQMDQDKKLLQRAEVETSKQEEKIATVSQQLKDCRDVVIIDAQTLDLSSKIILLSANVITLVSDGISEEDISVIEESTDKVNQISTQISALKKEIMPLAEKCWKDTL